MQMSLEKQSVTGQKRSLMHAFNPYRTSSSAVGFQGQVGKSKGSNAEFYPKCTGAASFKFTPVHNIGWSLPVNPMKKSVSQEQFTPPSQAYSLSQLKVMHAEPLIAAEFSSNLARLSSGVRLQPPMLAPVYSDSYRRPAKYGYQQNIFKYKNSAPLISRQGKDESSSANAVESWNVKKDFAFIREGDGGRDIMEIKDTKKDYIGLGSVFFRISMNDVLF
jgi:hypothetical protein